MTEQELREDLDVLNVVNFGGGSYVLYAEVQGDEIEVDPEPYSDNFARPARLLPLEAKALVAAIDLLGDHLPEGSLASRAPEDRQGARRGPGAGGAPDRAQRRRRLRPRPHDQPGDRRLPAGVARVLQGERGRVHQAHDRAVRADQRARGLVRVQLRPGARTTRATSASTGSSRRRSRARRSSRAPRWTRTPTSRAGRAPARCRRRGSRASGSRPSAPAGSASGARWPRSWRTAR